MNVYHVYFRDRWHAGREYVSSESSIAAKTAVEKLYPYCTVISVQRSTPTTSSDSSVQAFRQELPSPLALDEEPNR